MRHMENLDAQIAARFSEVWARFVKLYPQLSAKTKPTFSLSKRLTKTAGHCSVDDRIVTLGYKFFIKPENYGYMMRETIPHEIAHQVAVDLYGYPKNNRWHGSEWKKVMLDYGLAPNTYHPMTL